MQISPNDWADYCKDRQVEDYSNKHLGRNLNITVQRRRKQRIEELENMYPYIKKYYDKHYKI